MNTSGREQPERRLAAILAADVAGYSRLIGADEERTLGRLRSSRHRFPEKLHQDINRFMA
jgi:hypothetical protein